MIDNKHLDNIGSDKREQLTTPAVLVIVFAGLLVATFVPQLRLWGLHSLGYLPSPLAYVALVLVALAFVPVVARRGFAAVISGACWLEKRTPVTLLTVVVLSASSAFGFLRFRSATNLLGDTKLQADLWSRLASASHVDLAGFWEFVMGDFHQTICAGTNVVTFVAARAAVNAGRSDPLDYVAYGYALIGAVTVLTLLLFVRNGTSGTTWKVIVAATGFTSGLVLFFFGYFETYAHMAIAVVWYLMAAHHAISSRRRWYLAPAAYLVAVGFNLHALLLAPSLLMLGFIGVAGPSPEKLRRAGVVIAALTLAAVIGIRLVPEWSKFFLPWWHTDAAYGVLTPTHFLDLVNEALLTFPMLALLIPAAVLAHRWRKAQGEDRSNTIGAATWSFGLTLVTPCVLFLLMFHPDLGMAPDWDLYTLPMLGVVVTLLVSIRRWAASDAGKSVLSRNLIPALVISLAVMVPWLAVNANEERSLTRYFHIIENDRMSGAYGQEILALYREERGQWSQALAAWERAYDRKKNPRYLVAQALSWYALDDSTKAGECLKESVRRFPEHELGRRAYGDFLLNQGRFEEALPVVMKSAELFPKNPFVLYQLGVGLLATGQVAMGLEAFNRAENLGASTAVRQAIARLRHRVAEQQEQRYRER